MNSSLKLHGLKENPRLTELLKSLKGSSEDLYMPGLIVGASTTLTLF